MSTSSMNTDNNDNLFGLDRSDRAIVRFLHYHTGWFGTVLAWLSSLASPTFGKLSTTTKGSQIPLRTTCRTSTCSKCPGLSTNMVIIPLKTSVAHPEFPNGVAIPDWTTKASSSLTAKAARDTAQKVAKSAKAVGDVGHNADEVPRRRARLGIQAAAKSATIQCNHGKASERAAQLDRS
ncbi:hypothetical protein HMN09_00920900 [Mycena chlorophos]|uniref:Uncharacterized protein n=1 Tax=Mycena chlorophos TaxID=658473 RepID=A0A8H6W2A9_MYCCL|nr:hypothetical protein HMN09_00920900 [Mycena chlorophos]